MEASFWHQRWEQNQIGFHESAVNPLLIKYLEELSLEKDNRVFLPLCGKTLDITWLLSNDYRVAGVELSEMAIEQLFVELGKEPEIVAVGNLKHYSAENIDIFVGDMFDLSENFLGHVDATYDRAALVALPETMRNQYIAHLMKITNKAPQLLLCFEYDQSLMDGPPFSVSNENVKQYYGDSYDLKFMESKTVEGRLKERCAAIENVWLLQNHSR